MTLHQSGRLRVFLLWIVPFLALIICGFVYLLSGRFISTDNAYIQAARVDVNCNVSGPVTAVFVKENQAVLAGTPLFQIDSRAFVIAVQQAQANLADVRLQIEALKATYARAMAMQKAALDDVVYQEKEYNRQKTLAAQGVISQARLDQAWQQWSAAKDALNVSQQTAQNALATLGGDAHVVTDKHPLVLQAVAALDKANLDLSYTRVAAAMDGVVTKIDQLHPGDAVVAGRPLFALVSDKNVWVQANFKETDLTYMHVGQPVQLTVDAYPGQKWVGKISSISPGTGATFSLLPAENATGNWVKVVQRLSVRIVFDAGASGVPQPLLVSGMSVDVNVDTGHNRLYRLWHGFN